MALFNRNKTNQAGMSPEITEYYESKGRDKQWMAWLLAIVTLLITIFIVLGLFYGGRWAFRTLKNDDKSTPVVVQTDEVKTDETKINEQASNDTIPSESETSSTSSINTSTNSNSDATSNTATPTNTSTQSDDLPNTGPGDTLAVFVAVSVLGYLAHRKFLTS